MTNNCASNFTIEYAVHRVIGSRNYQEDEYTCLHPTPEGASFFAVFDGHGTDEFSKHASRNLHRLLFHSAEFRQGNVSGAFQAAFREEDKLLYEEFSKQNKSHGGSTATVAVVVDGKLHLANVGDSRAVLAMRPGPKDKIKAYRISHDHKTNDPTEAQRVLNNDGEIRGDRVFGPEHSLNMTRALGDHEYKAVPENQDRMSGDQVSWEPYIAPVLNISAHETPFLILASDGLWDNFDDYSIVKLVRSLLKQGSSLQQICQQITKQCGKSSHADNVTMILVRFVEPPSNQDSSKQKA